jgi:hypothetical protein
MFHVGQRSWPSPAAGSARSSSVGYAAALGGAAALKTERPPSRSSTST